MLSKRLGDLAMMLGVPLLILGSVTFGVAIYAGFTTPKLRWEILAATVGGGIMLGLGVWWGQTWWFYCRPPLPKWLGDLALKLGVPIFILSIIVLGGGIYIGHTTRSVWAGPAIIVGGILLFLGMWWGHAWWLYHHHSSGD